jgi:hypothetical protein
MQEPAASLYVHEEKHDQDRLGEGDEERDREIEDAEIDVTEAPSEREEGHQPEAIRPVDLWRMNLFHQR